MSAAVPTADRAGRRAGARTATTAPDPVWTGPDALDPRGRIADVVPAAGLDPQDLPGWLAGRLPDGPRPVTVVLALRADDAPAAGRLLGAYGAELEQVRAQEKVSGRAGELVRVPVAAPDGLPQRVQLLGIGDGGLVAMRQAGAALGRGSRGRECVLAVLPGGLAAADVAAFVEGVVLGSYLPLAGGVRDRTDTRPARVLLPGAPQRAVDLGVLRGRCTVLARDLAATPSNVKTPAWVADAAQTLAPECGLQVSVLAEEELAAQGFGGILAVGAGSVSPPRLVQLELPGRGRPVVLVGKGITYDSGGLSIKPREAMVPMKTDMSGAGAVLAALAFAQRAGVRRRVVGLLPLAENAFGGSSYRPGDVVRHYGGRTTEVANTDAEGRMVLADALAYAHDRLDPAAVVDVATLTGAASLGLGRRHGALFSTDERLAERLLRAAEDTGERLWRMPLVEDYRPALDSEVADLRHVAGRFNPGGGAITAALFLREFAGGRSWAHLDIAGPARSERDEHEVCRGATGFAARLLLSYLAG